MIQPHYDNMVVPQKVITEVPYDLTILILVIHPKEMKGWTWVDIFIPVFIAALFIIAKSEKHPMFHRGMNTQNVYATYYGILLILRRNEILTHFIKWVTLEDTVLHEQGQTQNDKSCVHDSIYTRYLAQSNA